MGPTIFSSQGGLESLFDSVGNIGGGGGGGGGGGRKSLRAASTPINSAASNDLTRSHDLASVNNCFGDFVGKNTIIVK